MPFILLSLSLSLSSFHFSGVVFNRAFKKKLKWRQENKERVGGDFITLCSLHPLFHFFLSPSSLPPFSCCAFHTSQLLDWRPSSSFTLFILLLFLLCCLVWSLRDNTGPTGTSWMNIKGESQQVKLDSFGCRFSLEESEYSCVCSCCSLIKTYKKWSQVTTNNTGTNWPKG